MSLVQCMLCGKICTAKEAIKHKIETGHDKWEFLKEKK